MRGQANMTNTTKLILRLATLLTLTTLLSCGGGGGSVTRTPPPDPLKITTTSLPDGIVGQSYSQALTASGGTGARTWSILSSQLPVGLTFDSSTGTISGMPTTAESQLFIVQVAAGGQTATVQLSITIRALLAITTDSALPDASVGTYYNVRIDSTGSPSTRWTVSAGTLPSGFSISNAGGPIYIQGYSNNEVVSNFTLKVQDGTQTATKDFTLRVIIPPLTITTASQMVEANTGFFYQSYFNASGGSGTFTWSLISGSLPEGIRFENYSSYSTVVGLSLTPGAYSFTIQVTDGTRTTSKNFMLNVKLAPLTVTTATLWDELTGTAYYQTISTTGGSGNKTWEISSGGLPPGLTLTGGRTSATIAGTGTAVGAYDFTVTIQDDSATVSHAYTIRVSDPLAITTSTIPDANTGQPYSVQFQASGGAAPLRWYAAPTDLPPGMSLTSDGLLQGTSFARDGFDFWVYVNDSNRPTQSAHQRYHLNVLGPLDVLTTSLPRAVLNVPYTIPVMAAGGIKPYSWSLLSGSLPTGLSFDTSTALITGTPTGPTGTQNFTVKVTDSSPAPITATRDLSITVQNTLGRNDTPKTATYLYTRGWMSVNASISPYADPADIPNPDSDYYRLTASGGANVSVSVSNIYFSNFDPVLEIVDENGIQFTTCTGTYTGDPRCLSDSHNSNPSSGGGYLSFKVPGHDKTTFYIHVLDYYGDARPDYQYQLSISAAD
jgi:hypothetical protein